MEFVGTIIAPGLISDSSVETASEFLNTNYEDGDKIIVYGYSYGGDAAVEFAESVPDTKIDLVVTVDSSDGLIGAGVNATVNQTIPTNTKESLNVYQTDQTTKSGADGQPHHAADEKKTKETNVDASAPDVTHGNIQGKKKDLIQTTINNTNQKLIIDS